MHEYFRSLHIEYGINLEQFGVHWDARMRLDHDGLKAIGALKQSGS